MLVASELNFVIKTCCLNETLINSLPKLDSEFEYCQRRFKKFIERKKGVYPEHSDGYYPLLNKLIEVHNYD